MEKYDGKFPQTLEELRTLPGVGEYTSRAISVFAFGKSYIAPDVNVLRILGRSFPSPFFKGEVRRGLRDGVRALIATGDAIVTPKTAYDVNQALMDLGRTVCTAKNPKSALCPLHEDCAAGEKDLPKKVKRQEPLFAGVPRRIWRGRVVELVRHAKRPLRLEEVLKKLGVESDQTSIDWFMVVSFQLQKESLIKVKKSKFTLFLSL